jgi:hypothetical protein
LRLAPPSASASNMETCPRILWLKYSFAALGDDIPWVRIRFSRLPEAFPVVHAIAAAHNDKVVTTIVMVKSSFWIADINNAYDR